MKKRLLFAGGLVLLAVLACATGDSYLIALAGTAMTFGLLAASVDLALGYCGILNLGAALHFGIGCYFMAYGLKAGWFWPIGILAGVIVSVSLSLVIGYMGFRRSVAQIQYALLGLVLSLAIEQIAIRSYDLAGGSNGISNVPTPTIIGSVATSAFFSEKAAYLISVGILVAILLMMLNGIAESHFGRVMQCVREHEGRAAALGYNPLTVKLTASSIAVAMSAVAGSLYIPFIGIAQPGLFGVTPNMEVLVLVALGGQRTILGPFLCAVALKFLQFELGSHFENVYLLIVGLLFIVVVVRLPGGIGNAILSILPVVRSTDKLYK
jgi:ABC-type branched-subunit amino acid transport system permease subunit